MPKVKGAKDIPAGTIDIIMRKHNLGQKNAHIARDLLMHRMTVGAIIRRNGQSTKKTGRKRKLSPTCERRILRTVQANPGVYATELAKELAPVVSVNARTIRRLLRRHRSSSKIVPRKPLPPTAMNNATNRSAATKHNSMGEKI